MFRNKHNHSQIKLQNTTSFPEAAAACPSDTEDSQEDELLLHDEHLPSSQHSSLQNIITDKLQKTLLGETHEEMMKQHVLQWEEKLKADAIKSKAVRLHQQQRAKISSASSIKARKSLPREIVAVLEEMEYDAEEEVRRDLLNSQLQSRNTNDTSSIFGIGIGSIGGSTTTTNTTTSSSIHAQQNQLHYQDTLYKLGVLEQQISTLQTTIQKLSKKSSRPVGITSEQRHRLKNEIQQYKRELTKAESEMISTRKVVDAQLRTLFLIKLEGELVELEDGVKRKEGEVKKWEVVLRRAEMEIEKSRRKGNDEDDEDDDDSESSSSSSSSGCSSEESGDESDDDDDVCLKRERVKVKSVKSSRKTTRKATTRSNGKMMEKQKKNKKMGRKALFHR